MTSLRSKMCGRAVLGLSLLGAGCAGKLNALVAPTSDYADYRLTRAAPTVPERLQAAARYLKQHPDGAFRDAVARWYGRIEPLFFEASSDTLAGVEKYLDTLPHGPHANSAEQLRDAFRAAARVTSGEGIAAQGAAFERRLAAAAKARDDVLVAYTAWVGRALDFDAWGRPPGEASEPFSSAWLADPKPKCTPERCTKLLTLPYELEIAGKPETFVCLLEITLRLTKGRVADVTIAGPALFARLAEAHLARPATADDQGRASERAWAIELTAGAAERRLPRSRCTRDGAPRAALARECDGRRLDLYAAGLDESEDRVVIRGPGEL
ncbi:MAG TPA: hypothetical protein VK540_03625 [Polyangiaceae bacterium]|nr:hypothetical protein [Polyangiaceae bacterium]